MNERTQIEQAVITALEEQFTDACEDLEADSSSTTPEHLTLWGILERMGIGAGGDETDTRIQVYDAVKNLHKRGEIEINGNDANGQLRYFHRGDAYATPIDLVAAWQRQNEHSPRSWAADKGLSEDEYDAFVAIAQPIYERRWATA